MVPAGGLFAQLIEVSETGRWVLIALFFVVGGAFGSFLNVVAYRSPRRMSLLFPPSRCPNCEHAIRWRDNVPILGWLWLGGQCRDCHAPISPRYPLVELLLAVSGSLVAWKLMTPVIVDSSVGQSSVLLDVAALVFWMTLVWVLVCAALVEFDGHSVPHWLLWAPLVPAVILVVVAPEVVPQSSWTGALGDFDGAIALGIGLVCGLLLGLPLALGWVARCGVASIQEACAAVGELMLVGAFLGEWGVIVVGLTSAVLYILAQMGSRKWPTVARWGLAGWLVLGTLAWMLGMPANSAPTLMAGLGPSTRFIVALVIMTLLATVLQFVPPRPSVEPARNRP